MFKKINKNSKHLFTFKNAFTLAEVLITLGIIGIVAAMTIPNLIAEHQKRTTVTKLQRAMSVLNQAYRRAYDDVGEVTEEDANTMNAEEYFNKYWAPYIKAARLCTSNNCGYDRSIPFQDIRRRGYTDPHIIGRGRVTFSTLDGFTYIIFFPKAINADVLVDINGASKPNVFGKDAFYFSRAIDGEKGGVVLPFGYDNTSTQINNNCSKTGTGVRCAEKIRRAGWQIDKSYPW